MIFIAESILQDISQFQKLYKLNNQWDKFVPSLGDFWDQIEDLWKKTPILQKEKNWIKIDGYSKECKTFLSSIHKSKLFGEYCIKNSALNHKKKEGKDNIQLLIEKKVKENLEHEVRKRSKPHLDAYYKLQKESDDKIVRFLEE